MSVLWIAIGIGIVALILARVWSLYHSPEAPTLGTVSEQWLAEQRTNHLDSHR